jgi:hypothetical protein
MDDVVEAQYWQDEFVNKLFAACQLPPPKGGGLLDQ